MFRSIQRRSVLRGALLSAAGALAAPPSMAGASRPAGSAVRHRARTLDAQALHDILVGCSFLGCGGGGSLAEGVARLEGAQRAGLSFQLLSVADLGDDEWVASPYGLGSSAPPSEEDRSKYEGLARTQVDPVEASFGLLSEFLQRRFVAVIPGELGPWSVAAALATAARLGIPTLDADRVGRATPEATQDSVMTAGLSTVPLAAVTGFGDSMILQTVARGSRVEDLLRAISVTSMGELGVTDAALSGRDARRPGALVLDSLSQAEKLGRARRQAMASGSDPIAAVVGAGAGFNLFAGEVTAFPWKNASGFLDGEVLIEGRGAYQGSRYRIRYLNEHLTAWRDEVISVMPPDLISVVDTLTGAAITNPEFTVGQAVSVIGFRAPALWRTVAGLKVFGPAHFGLDSPYVPIENLHREQVL